jgi:hypothetical protein
MHLVGFITKKFVTILGRMNLKKCTQKVNEVMRLCVYRA